MFSFRLSRFTESLRAENSSVISLDGRGHEPWRIGTPATHGAAAHREGARAETVSVQNRRGASRHSEYAIQAERVWIKRVGAGSSLDGEHDGAEADF